MTTQPDDIYVVTGEQETRSEKILIVTANDTEDLEFFYPYYRFSEEGYHVDVATPEGGAFKAKHGLGLKQTIRLKDVNPDQYQLLYIPGGKAPAELIKNKEAIAITTAFVESQKIVAAICHGPQLLAAANVIKGRNITAFPEVQKEVHDAGGNYKNEATVIDGQFVTARWPADLPLHMANTLKALEKQLASVTTPRRANQA